MTRAHCLAVVTLTARVVAADPVALAPVPLQLVEARTAVPSLRLEAVRVAAERFDGDWRYPVPGPMIGLDGGAWFVGTGFYQPRSKRAAALHGGAAVATMIGELLLATDSPLAALGALATGVTLDAATADVDRDVEARKPVVPRTH